MPNAIMTGATKLKALLLLPLFTMVGVAACLQFDLPLPEQLEAEEVQDRASIRALPMQTPPSTNSEVLGPTVPSGPIRLLDELEHYPNGAVTDTAEAPQEQQAGVPDAGPLPPAQATPPRSDSNGLDDRATSGSLCAPGSVVFVEDTRYVCGGHGEAYNPALLWLLSS